MNKTTALLEHLKTGKTITSLEAWNRFGISSLPTVISQLKAKGNKIGHYGVTVRDRYHNKCRVNRYYMVKLIYDQYLYPTPSGHNYHVARSDMLEPLTPPATDEWAQSKVEQIKKWKPDPVILREKV